MRWIKKGLIYGPDGKSIWAKYSALQPTPYMLNNDIIRIYVGFRDEEGVSRVGFVDVKADDPTEVIRVSEKPALNIGAPGTFDENGVVPCAVVEREGAIYLYYAGYQLGQKVRFFVFSGLGISTDGGESFVRHRKVPLLERCDNELFFRVIHSIMLENHVWKVWYGAGSEFIDDRNKTLPVYNVRYLESPNGVTFSGEGLVCVDIKEGDEYRIGRPSVIKAENIYRMFYGHGTKSKGYRLGYAESIDGRNWKRKDEEIGIDVSEDGWDSKMIGYPGVIRYRERVYMFYNGNNFGENGFGYAVLEEW